MAAPTFVAASAGSTDATGAWSHTGMTPAQAGNVILLQILVDGVTAGTPTVTSVTNIESLDGVDGNMEQIAETYPVGSATAAGQLLFIGRSLSTSAPVVTGANVGGDDVYVRMYEFENCSTATVLAAVIENGSPGATSNTADTSDTASDTAVTALGPDRLALNFLAINDDNAFAGFTGETGGTWVTQASYATGTGTDGAIYLIDAAMPTGITIDGGTGSTTASDAWGVVGFALIGTTAQPANEASVNYIGA